MQSNLKSKYEYTELEGLPANFFQLNRDKFFKSLAKHYPNHEKNSILLMEGGHEIPKYDCDTPFSYFQQESNFYYLTGVLLPDFYCSVDLEAKTLILFYDQPDEMDQIWEKIPALDELSKRFATKVLHFKTVFDYLKERKPDVIYTLKGVNSDSGLSVKSIDFEWPEEHKLLKDLVKEDNCIYEALAEARVTKSPEEIEILKFTSEITVEAHKEVLTKLKPGITERNAESIFTGYLSCNYHTRFVAYPCICCSGVDSAILHYHSNDQTIKDGQLLLFDMGGRFAGYCSDITSTAPVNGKYTEKQKQIYDLVLKANRDVMLALKPGVNWRDMHLLAEKTILEGLQKLNILNKEFPLDELIENRIMFYFQPHGLGHLIGLEIHDVGGYLSFLPKRMKEKGLDNLRFNREIEENMVITVEPGCYFIEVLLKQALKDEMVNKYFNEDVLKTYLNFGGIRIEDVVVITNNGAINLSEGLPRTTEDIEKYMACKK